MLIGDTNQLIFIDIILGVKFHMNEQAELYNLARERNRPFATNGHMVQNPPCWSLEGKLIIIPALGQLNNATLSCQV